MKKKTDNSGQIILEVIIGIAVAAFFIVGSATLSAVSLRSTTAVSRKNQANLLLQSELEKVKAARDSAWTELSDTTEACPGPITSDTDSCHVETVAGALALKPNLPADTAKWQTTFEGITFKRKVVISAVNRNTSTGEISASGASDPSTKQITIRVEWTDNNTSQQVELSIYLTRGKNSDACNQQNWSGGTSVATATCTGWTNFTSQDGNLTTTTPNQLTLAP